MKVRPVRARGGRSKVLAVRRQRRAEWRRRSRAALAFFPSFDIGELAGPSSPFDNLGQRPKPLVFSVKVDDDGAPRFEPLDMLPHEAKGAGLFKGVGERLARSCGVPAAALASPASKAVVEAAFEVERTETEQRKLKGGGSS